MLVPAPSHANYTFSGGCCQACDCAKIPWPPLQKAIRDIFKQTPSTHPESFERIKHTPAYKHKESGFVIEKDHTNHGGKQAKWWNNQKDWEKGRGHISIYEGGKIRGGKE